MRPASSEEQNVHLLRNTISGFLVVSALIPASALVVHGQGQKRSAGTVTSLAPQLVNAGTQSLQLVVRGSGFTDKSQLRIDSEHRATVFRSSTELRSQPGAKIDVVYFRNVRVNSGWPGNGWDYIAAMRTIGPRGTTVVGNSLALSIGSNLRPC